MRRVLTRICVTLTAVLFLIGQQSPVNAANQVSYTLKSDIVYKKTAEYELKLDFCLPNDDNPRRPTLVFFHGGGFRNGDKKQGLNLLCELVTAKGYNFVTAEYRLSPEHVYPAQLDDGQYVFRWLRKNAEKYHVAKKKMIVVGTSAGATLSAVIATREGTRNPSYGLRTYSSRPQGAIVLAGVYDFTDPSLLGGWDPRGYLLSDRKAYIEAFSAVTHVSSDDGPFLLLHGTEDETNLPIQSERMRAKLKENDVPVRLVTFSGVHGGENYLKPVVQEAVVTYLKKYFPLATGSDINDDGTVDIFDFNLLIEVFGQPVSVGSTADITEDGIIDMEDYNKLVEDMTK